MNKIILQICNTSNYPKIRPSGIDIGPSKKAIGIFKDEVGGQLIFNNNNNNNTNTNNNNNNKFLLRRPTSHIKWFTEVSSLIKI